MAPISLPDNPVASLLGAGRINKSAIPTPTGKLAIPDNPLSQAISRGALTEKPAVAIPVVRKPPVSELEKATEAASAPANKEFNKVAGTTGGVESGWNPHDIAAIKAQAALHPQQAQFDGDLVNPIEWAKGAVQGGEQAVHGAKEVASGNLGQGAGDIGVGAIGVAGILPFGGDVLGAAGDAARAALESGSEEGLLAAAARGARAGYAARKVASSLPAVADVSEGVNNTLTNGGHTWNSDLTNDVGQTGHDVSLAGHEKIVPAVNFNAKTVRDFRIANHEIFKADPTLKVGALRSGDNVILDVTRNVENKEAALKIGQRNGQESIWDRANQKEIPVPGGKFLAAARRGELDPALEAAAIQAKDSGVHAAANMFKLDPTELQEYIDSGAHDLQQQRINGNADVGGGKAETTEDAHTILARMEAEHQAKLAPTNRRGLTPRTPEEAQAHIKAAVDQAVNEGHGPNDIGSLGYVESLNPGETSPETAGSLGARVRAALNGKTDLTGTGEYERLGIKSDNLDKSVRTLRKEQEKLREVERGKRAGRIAERIAAGDKEGARAAREGKLPSVMFHGFDQFTPEEKTQLEDHVMSLGTAGKLHPYEATRTLDAIDEITAGKVPTLSDQRLLARAFGREKGALPIGQDPRKDPGWIRKVADMLNIPQTMEAGMDISSPFRQALVAGATHPIKFASAFGPMIRAIKSDAYATEHIHDAILEDPMYPLAHKGGVQFTEVAHDSKDALKREDQFMSNYATRIPGYGKLLIASNRGFVGFLNIIRMSVFKDLVAGAAKEGWDVNDRHLLESVGEVVNAATGRGSLGALQKHVVVLNALLFAPRLLASRLNYLGFGGYGDVRSAIPGSWYMHLHPVARREALKGLLSTAAFGATILGLAKMGGVDVSTNPTSSDFAKIKVGNTRIDVLGGFQQVLKLAAVLETGKVTSTTTGTTRQLGSGFGQSSRFDEALNFLESKASPIPSLIVAALKGKDYTGATVKWNDLSTYERAAGRNLTPFLAQDMWSLYQGSGKYGLLASPLALIGFGATAYKSKAPSSSSGSGAGAPADYSGGSSYGGGGSYGGGSSYGSGGGYAQP